MNLKNIVKKEFYNQLKENNILTDLESCLDTPALIGIDEDDLAKISNDNIVSTYSKSINDINDISIESVRWVIELVLLQTPYKKGRWYL